MFERILVGTDGSATARCAVDRAAELAGATGASLTVLCAGLEDGQAVVEAERDRLADRGVEVAALAVAGDAASVIVRTARDGRFDLVVLGNRGMTGPARLFVLGTVPNKVSHALATSLLLVDTSAAG